ncbi:sensor histidine kinase [Echinicola jeungdonensis]|uniref:sensor histidine kinase n=1 Tax=Echinicola jeungdonensis TaxID=709343 RepID=UPI00338E781C
MSWNVALPHQFWVRQFTFFILLIGLFYINQHLWVPNLLFKSRVGWFLLLTIGVSVILMYFLEYYENWLGLPKLMHQAFHPEEEYIPRKKPLPFHIFNLIVAFLTLGISTSVAAVKKWQADEFLRQQLDQQRIKSELSYLKAQINPHFFFNTLNNIYSLTNIDVERAQTALHKLSRLMRYVLYETEKGQTLLSREIDFIKDYIELMKLRISEKVKINLDIQEQMEEKCIAPMILLPFIENCFKHGISSQQQSVITVKLSEKDQVLHLYTCNNIISSYSNSPESQAKGIGLTNTKRRLSLLYAQRFQLEIDDQNPEMNTAST